MHIILFFGFGHATRHAGSQFPDQRSNPCPLQRKCGGLTTGPPGKSDAYNFVHYFFHSTLTSQHFHHVMRVFTTTIFNDYIVFQHGEGHNFFHDLFNHSLIERHLSHAQILPIIMLNITFSFISLGWTPISGIALR